MPARTALLLCLILHTFSSFIECSVISQSSVTLCENAVSEPSSSEGTTCSKKMLVTMGLKAGQKGSESLYANIDRVYQEGEEELTRLKNPFRIEIRKSEVTVTYPLYYKGSANAQPREEYILQQSCSDDWHLESSQLSCGKFHDGTEYVFDSQGFCCRCSKLSILNFNEGIDNMRANHSCHLFGGVYASAHCLRFSDLWYDIYDIGPPYLWYNITIDILEFGGVEEEVQGGRVVFDVHWNPVASVVISPEALLRRSDDGKVIAEIQGELVGGRFIRDFSTKYLGVPNIIHWPADNPYPEQYTNGASDWLVVDKHNVDLSGKTCNKIGTSFTAFRYQDKPCTQEQFSCLREQPLHFWEMDDDLRQEDKPGHFMLYNFGEIHPSTAASNDSVTLRFRYNDFQNTLVTFQIDASDITYVYSIASGRIVNAYANNFEALKGNGFIYVEIENTGEVTSEFSVSVTHCTHGVTAVSGRSVDLDPGEAREFTFQIRTYKAMGSDYSCEVQLFDADYNLIQSAQVSFATNGTCFCYGICGCVCNPLEELVCPEPPTLVVSGDLAKRILFIILKSLGAHGIALLLGGMLLILGCIKLSFGKLIFCRKTKAEAMAEELKKQGLVNQQGPMLVMCGGKCTGARAAKARYERQAQRRKKLGKKPLDKNWRNSSYACTCDTELTDVRCVAILRSIFFFFFCCFLPFVALGKRVTGRFQATEKVKRKAERKVIRTAAKKGKAHKYLVGEELGNVQGAALNNGWEDGEGEGSSEEESNWLLQATEEVVEERRARKEVVGADASKTTKVLEKSNDETMAKTSTT